MKAASLFDFKGTINWFPGHMHKATKLIQEKLAHVDTVLEEVNSFFIKQGLRSLFIIGEDKQRCKQIIPFALEGTGNFKLSEKKTQNILIVGVPNVGKSTIINSIKMAILSGKKVAKTGPLPGVTRSINGFRVSDNPIAYLLDTPGIMVPNISKEENEKGLKLGLIGCIKDSVITTELLAQYLLFTLNKKNIVNYVNLFNLKNPTEDIVVLLTAIALKINARIEGNRLDIEHAARFFLQKYRTGELGLFMLDDLSDIPS